MKRPTHTNTPPAWWDDGFIAIRAHYRRIHMARHVCRCCGERVHVATKPIDKEQSDASGLSFITIFPAVYAFCRCAQSITHPRGRSWEQMARLYHEKIAAPESGRHRDNMLRGYPSTRLIALQGQSRKAPPLPPLGQGDDQDQFAAGVLAGAATAQGH